MHGREVYQPNLPCMVGRSRKYTKELLEPVVKSSLSIAEVVSKLGMKWSGGTHGLILRRIREYGIDTSHLLGQRANSRDRHRGHYKVSPETILVFNRSGRREEAARLRRALAMAGMKYECQSCGLCDEWNGKPIRLQVDHVDGNYLDNRIHNLRFLCPNCHSQTETWGSKNKPL